MASAPAKGRSPALRWALRAGLLVLIVLVVIAVLRTMYGLNAGAIVASLGRLRWWEIAVLLALLVLRQLLAALPLTVYIPGLSLWRATVSDLTALTTAALASAPGKIAARIAIYTSWGIPAAAALAGTVLATLTLFVARFGVPLVGFVLAGVGGTYRGWQLIDVLSLCFSVALVVTLMLVASAETTAVRVGRWAARAARRFRVRAEPEQWGSALARFQQAMSGGLARRLPRALATVAVTLTCELAILVCAFRFVGVTPADASVLAIATIFCFAYPLTMFPLQGAGVLDVAVLLFLFGTRGGPAADAATAGLLIWRALTVAGPYALAGVAVGIWRGGRLRRRSAERSG